MSDRVIFDGTLESVHALFEWAGQRFPSHERHGNRVDWIAVSTHPGTFAVEAAYPGDSIVRGPDDVLTVERSASQP